MEILKPSWRGRFLSTRKGNDGKKYMAMCGERSLLYIPVDVLPNTTYMVSLEIYNESGNGIVFCNIYGNRNFDFPHVKIECKNNIWDIYNINIVTRDIIKTIPFVFRLWRIPEGTGTILIKNIKVELLDEDSKEQIIIINDNLNIKTLQVNTVPSVLNRPDESKSELSKKSKPDESKSELSKKSKPDESKHEPSKNIRHMKNRQQNKQQRNENLFTPTPKPLPPTVGEDGIKVSVVISIYNRKEFFDRTLMTYVKQTLPKEEFEIIVVDDNSSEDIFCLCKKYSDSYGLRFQYILIDSSKGAVPQKGFTPALSNNIGFKLSRGSVIVITGPESLQSNRNLEISYNCANTGYCIYGNIFRSSEKFVDELCRQNLQNLDFEHIVKIPGAKIDASTITGWWWYYVAVRKEHIFAINGVDEHFMEGIAGEDDNFALRMCYSGVPLIRNSEIIGIHQDHSREDRKDIHSFRFDDFAWKKLREFNMRLLEEWQISKDVVANKNIDWGTLKAVVKREVF